MNANPIEVELRPYVDNPEATSLRTLDVCAGSGMLGEGVCTAIPRSRVVGFIERQAHSAATLLERMESQTLPPAPIWCGDLCEFDAAAYRGAVDCVVAGFPCQPWSLAGSRKGTADERWILPDILDLAVECGAPLIALENNRGLDVAEVVNQLDRRGYVVAWVGLEAADVGAAHHRFRWFFLAYSDSYGQRSERVRSILDGLGQALRSDADGCGSSQEGADAERTRRKRQPWPSIGLREPSEEREGRTNADRSGQRSSELQLRQGQPDASGRDPEGADACGVRRSKADAEQPEEGDGEGSDTEVERRAARRVPIRTQPQQPDAGSDSVEGPDADSPGLEGNRAKLIQPQHPQPGSSHKRLFSYGPEDPRSWQQPPETQPAVGELVHGLAEVVDLPHRKQQLWLIGNGVVPLQAAVAYRVLAYRLSRHLEREAGDERAGADDASVTDQDSEERASA